MELRDSTLSTRPTPTWRQAYEAVLQESNTPKLFKLVEVAEAAVLTRRAALEGIADHSSESNPFMRL
jgi:hypothetical protein